MNYLGNIEDKQKFKESIKQRMDHLALQSLEDMKKEIANQILQSEDK